jgi:hypothetical protein
MEIKQPFELAMERITGESIESLRSMPIDERREMVEKKTSKLLRIVSRFPVIGRGSVLRDRLISRRQVEAGVDWSLNQ